MAVMERDVLLMGKDGDRQTMDFPITRLGNVEDTADVKDFPVAGDYLPIVDSKDGGQMKKTTVAALFAPFEAAVQEALNVVAVTLSAKQDKLTGAPGRVVGFGEDGTPVAQAALTMDDVHATIDEAITGAIEEVY